MEIGTKVEDRLWRWGKVLGGAAALLAVALAVFGFSSFEGARARIDQAASEAAAALNRAALDKKGELEKQASTFSGELEKQASTYSGTLEKQASAYSGTLKTDVQKAEGTIQSYAPREKAVNTNLERLEAALKERNDRAAKLQEIRDVNPYAPIGSINSQLFQTEAVPGGSQLPSYNATLPGISPSTVSVPAYSQGSKGEGVKAIQSRLTELGCYSGPVSGEFDALKPSKPLAQMLPQRTSILKAPSLSRSHSFRCPTSRMSD